MRPSRIVLRLSVGHFWIDAYASMLGALIPFLYRTHDLSFTQAGVLAGMLILSASFLQPLYGYLSDRWQSRVFTALGPAIAGIFICFLGLVSSYPLMLVFVFLGGIGIAAFHPQATALASRSSRTTPAFQLSFFITSGMMGYAAGPVLMGSLVAFAGLRWSILAALPGLLTTLYLLRSAPLPAAEERVVKQREVLNRLKEKCRPLLLLFALVVIRAALQMAFVAFLPLLLVLRGYSAVTASQILTVFLLMGASSGFLGGILADRAGGHLGFWAGSWRIVPGEEGSGRFHGRSCALLSRVSGDGGGNFHSAVCSGFGVSAAEHAGQRGNGSTPGPTRGGYGRCPDDGIRLGIWWNLGTGCGLGER